MTKSPVGWFDKPGTKEKILILPITGEDAESAIKRVAEKHGIEAKAVSRGAPSNPGHDVKVDDPHGAESKTDAVIAPIITVKPVTPVTPEVQPPDAIQKVGAESGLNKYLTEARSIMQGLGGKR